MANNTDDINKQTSATQDAITAQKNLNTVQNEGNDIQQKAKELIKESADFIKESVKRLEELNGTLTRVAKGQKDSIILTKQQTELFSTLSGVALGATKVFDNFGNITGVKTFAGTLKDAVNMASGLGSAGKTVLEGIAKTMGIDPRVYRSFDQLATKVLAVGTEMSEVADVGLKLQTGFLQMSAAGGGLNKVFEQAGPHLGNLNNLLMQQNKIITSAAGSTHATTEETVKWYNSLGRIPGYLAENIHGIDNMAATTNMLTASIKLAAATGQTQEDIIKDLTSAYTLYGESGEKALEFTAKIADLSQKYNIQIEDTRSFMTDTANAFKFLGDNAQGTADTFERFFKNLRDTGLSARSSKDIVDDFTKSMGNLTIAQKAFLSSRTGGPGGLMGAVQIEQEIRKGNLDQVRKRIEQALKQQFGRIVTQDEGAKSEEGAQQFVKQRMFLQQGPFGQIFGQGAEGEGKATRFLEAMAKPGGKSELGLNVLKEDMKRGTEITNKTLNPLTQAVVELEGIRMLNGIIALNTAQKAFGTNTKDVKLHDQLIGSVKDAMKAGAQAVDQGGKKQQQDTSRLDMTRAFKGLIDSAEMFGEGAKSGSRLLKNTFTGDNVAADTNQIQVKVPQNINTRMKNEATPTPHNITVHVNSVCPDCHKKFVSAQQSSAISNAPDLGPGF